jgi:hypothetical protein
MFEWVFRLFYHIGLMESKRKPVYGYLFKCELCINYQRWYTTMEEATAEAIQHHRIVHFGKGM